MYLTRGQVGGLRNAGSPELSFSPPHSSSQPPEWGRPGSLPGISPYQAHDAPVHPDLYAYIYMYYMYIYFVFGIYMKLVHIFDKIMY